MLLRDPQGAYYVICDFGEAIVVSLAPCCGGVCVVYVFIFFNLKKNLSLIYVPT